ncbi:hypothetical protein ACP4OV_006666 [Aristida adscensionis]
MAGRQRGGGRHGGQPNQRTSPAPEGFGNGGGGGGGGGGGRGRGRGRGGGDGGGSGAGYNYYNRGGDHYGNSRGKSGYVIRGYGRGPAGNYRGGPVRRGPEQQRGAPDDHHVRIFGDLTGVGGGRGDRGRGGTQQRGGSNRVVDFSSDRQLGGYHEQHERSPHPHDDRAGDFGGRFSDGMGGGRGGRYQRGESTRVVDFCGDRQLGVFHDRTGDFGGRFGGRQQPGAAGHESLVRDRGWRGDGRELDFFGDGLFRTYLSKPMRGRGKLACPWRSAMRTRKPKRIGRITRRWSSTAPRP